MPTFILSFTGLTSHKVLHISRENSVLFCLSLSVWLSRMVHFLSSQGIPGLPGAIGEPGDGVSICYIRSNNLYTVQFLCLSVLTQL